MNYAKILLSVSLLFLTFNAWPMQQSAISDAIEKTVAFFQWHLSRNHEIEQITPSNTSELLPNEKSVKKTLPAGTAIDNLTTLCLKHFERPREQHAIDLEVIDFICQGNLAPDFSIPIIRSLPENIMQASAEKFANALPTLLDEGIQIAIIHRLRNTLLSSYRTVVQELEKNDNLRKALSAECPICAEEKSGKELCVLDCCKFILCTDCLKLMLNIALKENNPASMKCPSPDCKRPITEEKLTSFTNDKQKIAQFSDVYMKHWLISHGKPCQTANCSGIFFNDDKRVQNAQCPECKQCCCGNCFNIHDNTTTCAQAINDKENEKWIKDNARQCPRCTIAIENIGGCNHMLCACCYFQFCFSCLSSWPPSCNCGYFYR